MHAVFYAEGLFYLYKCSCCCFQRFCPLLVFGCRCLRCSSRGTRHFYNHILDILAFRYRPRKWKSQLELFGLSGKLIFIVRISSNLDIHSQGIHRRDFCRLNILFSGQTRNVVLYHGNGRIHMIFIHVLGNVSTKGHDGIGLRLAIVLGRDGSSPGESSHKSDMFHFHAIPKKVSKVHPKGSRMFGQIEFLDLGNFLGILETLTSSH
mmetsp:Transcript_57690/g.167100  ORF Transcript_57690/g.167100 Transcript_57690/m.167100 type:complete len:207 (-) Transcript_57690:698-1318(-)